MSRRVLQELAFLSTTPLALQDDPAWLDPLLAAAAPKRRREYVVGRLCATKLLRRLRADSVQLRSGRFREPLWPRGIVGSITHTDRLVAVAAARSSEVRALGIDSEQLVGEETSREIATTCLHARERLLCGRIARLSRTAMHTLLFSAKESLFKCLYPLVHVYFDFLDAEIIEVDRHGGSVRIALLEGLSIEFPKGAVFKGRFRFSHGHVHTSFELPASGNSRRKNADPEAN